MKFKKLLIYFMIVLLAVNPCFSAIRISHKTVQPARSLARLLNNRIGTLDSQVATLQALSTNGLFDNIGTGDVFYVDSATGSDTDNGTTWATAKATLDAAIGLCTDGNNDVIYIASGHAETLAADVTLDIDGVYVIGIGAGVDRPEFTFDTTTDEFIIDAQGVTVYNLRFIAGVAEVAACFTLADESDYFSIITCEFPEPGTATFEFDKVFQLVTGADNGTIAYCTVINQGATPGMTSVVDGGAAAIDSLTLIGNHWNVDVDVALIFSDQADTNMLMANNMFIQEDVDKLVVQLTSTATGLIADNMFCNLGGTAYLLDPGSCHVIGNRASTAIDAASFDWPAVDSEGRNTGTGSVFYVDSGTPGAGDGRSWATAVATLDAGVNLCTTNAGDTIYIAAGHTETLGAGADGVDIDLNNITVIGLGSGKSVPYFDYDTTSDEFVIAGDNIHIKNLRFHSNITAVTLAIDIEGGAENFIIEDCLFDLETTGTDDFVDAIVVGAACHGGLIKNCRWYMGAGSDNDSAIHFVNADYLRIEGCDIYGDFVDASIFNETTKSLHVTIKDNFIFQGTENGTTGLNAKPGISVHADTSGMIVNNTIVADVASPGLAIVAAECFRSGNTYSEQMLVGGEPIGVSRPSSLLGVRVERAAADIFDGTTTGLFTIAGGRVLLTHLSMENSVAAADGTANNVKFVMNPTQGSDTDLCATLDVADDEQYTLYSITGEAADALVQSGAANSGAVQSMQSPMILDSGSLDLSSSGDSGSGGTDCQTSVLLWYFPLDDGATVVAQ